VTPLLVLALVGMAASVVGIALAGRHSADSAPGGAEPGAPRAAIPVAAAVATRHVPAWRRPPVVSAAVAAGLATVAVTRWPLAGLMVAVAALAVPSMVGGASNRRAMSIVEAVAVWTELLRDTLAAASGLAQAIVATAELASPAIRPQVTALADRITSGVPMDIALRAFAADMDDPSADLAVCALVLAATAHSQKLAELLTGLAEASREEVAMRLRVEASRASSRSSVRTVVVFSLAFAALLLVFGHGYLAPFGTATGQVVLAAVGGLYAFGLWLMVRLVRPRPGVRLLGGARP